MNARLLDVLHDPADHHARAVGNGVDVNLHGLIEETIEQDRRVVGHLHSVMHVALEFVVAVDNLHGATPEDIGRTHH